MDSVFVFVIVMTFISGVCVAVSRSKLEELASHRLAPAMAIIVGLVPLLLSFVTLRMYSGSFGILSNDVPPISPSTAAGAEYWVWAVGNTLNFVLFAIPCFGLLWDILGRCATCGRSTDGGACVDWLCCVTCCPRLVPGVSVGLLIISWISLVGLAVVPLKGPTESTHLEFAGIFFVSILIHEVVTLIWLMVFLPCSLHTYWSLTLKLFSLTFGFVAPGLIPMGPGGVQRVLVMSIIVFVMTYAIDIRAMQRKEMIFHDGATRYALF